MRATSVIAFRYNVICDLNAGRQEFLYNDIAVKVSSGEYAWPRQVIEAMKPVYPTDGQFKLAFVEKELKTTSGRNKKVVRHILFRIERQLSEREFDEESAKYNLEHILPEHPSEEWGDIPENIQEGLIYRLGNITLLESGLNRGIGNAGYAAKREAYRESDFQITRDLADTYDTWDEHKVEARQKKLAAVAGSIWKIDF